MELEVIHKPISHTGNGALGSYRVRSRLVFLHKWQSWHLMETLDYVDLGIYKLG